MRVINVIKVENNVIERIESFGVYEEQLSDEVVEKAEEEFLIMIEEEGGDVSDEEKKESYIDDGYWCDLDLGVDICIIWSEV